MKTFMAQGWRLALSHFHLVLLLFLYQLFWGLFIYRVIDGVVTPLLKRLPSGETVNASSGILDGINSHFLAEAQFQLLKTDLAHPYLWMLGGLFAARMLLTPLFNAGLLYSMHEKEKGGGKSGFLKGIRKKWLPVSLLYWLQTLLALLPSWWLLPRGLQAALQSASASEAAAALLPGAALWLGWGALLSLLFLAMQIGTVTGEGIWPSLWNALKRFLPYAGLTLAMWGIGLLASLTVSSLSFIWAGLAALIVHQGYHLVKTLLKVWTMASQLQCLQSRADS
ncbi:hypothetical protein ACX93W_25720 [Paenibacillus sp. CAU 1782]